MGIELQLCPNILCARLTISKVELVEQDLATICCRLSYEVFMLSSQKTVYAFTCRTLIS